MDFRKFKISESLISSLKSRGIVTPTSVQNQTIPLILEGKDVLVQSETGSGKTIGFAIPTLNLINSNSKQIQVLVIVPTRELAKQVGGEFIKFRNTSQKIAIVYGGVSIEKQRKEVMVSQIVIGTPGRLLDMLRRNMIDLSKCKFLIIDEADRLMDMGFIEDIDSIIRFLPEQRQTLMFSATISDKVINLMEKYTINPTKIMLENKLTNGVLEQFYYDVPENRKLSLLVHLLKTEKRGLTLVFCNTKRKTKFVADTLRINGFNAEYINGDLTQYKREQVMSKFKSGKIDVLVATDVAARGIHIAGISHVINYDIQPDIETYTHRIGRTARNGEHGIAITLLSSRDYNSMNKILDIYNNEIKKKKVKNLPRIKIPLKRNRNFTKRVRSY